LKPLSQEHSAKSADIARRSFWLHFGNSRCHSAKIVVEEMIRLKCKSVPHPPYSPDLAIAYFYLFSVLKQKLQSIDVSDDEELKSEMLTIFQGILSEELKSHSIIGSKDASGLPQMQESILRHSHKT
jgi:hypothetical protein